MGICECPISMVPTPLMLSPLAVQFKVQIAILLKVSQGWKWVYTRSPYAVLMVGKATNEKSNSAEQDEQSPSKSSPWRWGQETRTRGEKREILCICTDCKKSHFYWTTSLFFPSVVPTSGFEWGTYLENETSLAASVSCFRHVSPDCEVELEIVLPLGHTFSGFVSNTFIPTGEVGVVSSLTNKKQTEPLDCIQVGKCHLLWRMNFITTHKWNQGRKQLHLAYILLDRFV